MSTQLLTPEQTNVLIAESLGWKKIVFRGMIKPFELDYIGVAPGKEGYSSWLPNFHGSLDACAKFEATLNPEEQMLYAGSLHGRAKSRHYLHQDFDAITSTAPQRCRAYLKTKGVNL